MGLQNGVIISSQRISHACSKPSIRGRGTQVASAQAGAPQIIMRAGFGEAASTNFSKGKAYLIFCEKIAMLPRGTICS